MKKENKFIWILSGYKCFKVFSDKKYAEEHKEIILKKLKKVKILDEVPPVLEGYINIEKFGESYHDVISVNNQIYLLYKSSMSSRDGHTSWWHYKLLSEKEWKDHCQEFFDDFTLTKYKIEK